MITKASLKNKEIISGFLFMSPFFILMAVFVVTVFIDGFIISLSDARGMSFGHYIGFDNFTRVPPDLGFLLSIFNTVKISFTCLLTQVPMAFLLACWINSIPFKKIQALIQAAFFVPCLMTTMIVGILFQMLFTRDPFTGGPDFMNWFFGLLHLPHNFQWMLDRDNEFFMVVFASFWQNIGFEAVLFLAYLQAINHDLYEAARIDGANSIQIFFNIKIPLMRPALTYVIVTSLVASFLMNELTLRLFPGGPYKSGITIINYILYQLMLNQKMDLALGAAEGIIAFFIIMGVSLLQIPIFGLGRAHEE